jgi:dTDP-4-amino-4,6-dideoxygalactose transaminase
VIKFLPVEANAKDYPLPQVPMLPVKVRLCFFNNAKKNKFSAFNFRSSYYKQGRYALAEALKRTGVDESSAVLMPSYHCRSLIEPALYLKSHVVFYELDSMLRPDINKLLSLIAESGIQIKALVLPHYFGFPQDVETISDICKKNNIDLIEDCAHAFYGIYNGKKLGSFGRFSVASPRKFFPIEDGGILTSYTDSSISECQLTSLGFLPNLKAIVKSFLRMWKGNSDKKEIISIGKLITKDIVKKTTKIKDGDESSNFGLKYFDVNCVSQASLSVSKFIIDAADHQSIVKIRRANYQRWLEGINNVKGCHSLFPQLNENVVPYVFPLLIDSNAIEVFHNLKLNGVPLWRWEDLAETDCVTVNKYRLSLLQLPCHQDLSESQIDWMIDTVTKVVTHYYNGEV